MNLQKLNPMKILPPHVVEDSNRLKESCFGAQAMIRGTKHDRTQPRAIRNAEKNR